MSLNVSEGVSMAMPGQVVAGRGSQAVTPTLTLGLSPGAVHLPGLCRLQWGGKSRDTGCWGMGRGGGAGRAYVQGASVPGPCRSRESPRPDPGPILQVRSALQRMTEKKAAEAFPVGRRGRRGGGPSP